MKLKLSILDQSPVIKGGTAELALRNSLELARMADVSGYHSILYSEHHGVGAYGSSSPELLTAIVLAETKKIKAGTGGIMLRNYSAFKIAEWPKMLATMFPHRFILGLGKAPGGLKDAVLALNNNKPPVLNDLNKKLEEIIAYIKGQNPVYVDLVAQPEEPLVLPEILWLGSGVGSAKEAAAKGVGYSMAGFISDNAGEDAYNVYHEEFNNDGYTDKSVFQVALSVSVAADTEQARKNAYGMVYQFVQSRKLLAPDKLMPYAEVEALVAGSDDESLFYSLLDKVVIGTPDTISSQLDKKAIQYKTDDLMLLCNMFNEEDRLFTYKSIIENS